MLACARVSLDDVVDCRYKEGTIVAGTRALCSCKEIEHGPDKRGIVVGPKYMVALAGGLMENHIHWIKLLVQNL